jgi:cytochrome P450
MIGPSSTPTKLPAPTQSMWRALRDFGRDPLEAPGRYFDQFGETFQMRLFGKATVLTRDPRWFEEVLVKQPKAFHKDQTTKNLAALMGRGLLVRDGTSWRQRRRTISPSFLPTEIEKQVHLFASEARREVATWQADQIIDLHAAMARLAMRVALISLFGYDPAPSENFEAHMAAAMRYFEGIGGTQILLPAWIPTPTNSAFLRARSQLRSLAAHLLTRPAPAGTLLAALQTSLAEGELQQQDVLDEVMTLLVAGHETSALSLTYLLAELGLAPHLQETVAEEVRSFAQPPTVSNLTQRGAVHRTVLEGLRLYPVAWAIGREAIRDVEIDKHHVKRGTQVFLFQWSLQRSARYYERPLEFSPDRFLGQPTASLPKGAFAPFGLGPRICVGQQFALTQIAVALCEILRICQIETVSKYPPRLRASITARPQDPVLIRVTKR